MMHQLFHKLRGPRAKQSQTEGVATKIVILQERLDQVEAKLASEHSLELLEVRIDFALRLLAQATHQVRGVAETPLPAAEFQTETVEAMFDLAGRLIQRIDQAAIPQGRESPRLESLSLRDTCGIGSDPA